MTDAKLEVTSQIEQNANTLRNYYRLAAYLLVAVLILHVAYSAYFLHTETGVSYPRVALFASVSVSVLFVEVLLARVAFMLAGRLGQLFDTLYALDISRGDINFERFALAAQVLTTLRRQESTLKIVDVESVASGAVASASGQRAA